MGDSTDQAAEQKSKIGLSWLFKGGTWMVTLLCFYLVFTRTETTARLEGLTTSGVFAALFPRCRLDGLVDGDDPLLAVLL